MIKSITDQIHIETFTLFFVYISITIVHAIKIVIFGKNHGFFTIIVVEKYYIICTILFSGL